jgi:hypothetical protein
MKAKLLLIAALLTGSFSSFAHESIGPNGGRITDAGPYHIEMVAKSSIVDVFISDANDKPVPSSGFKGTAILVVEGKSQRVVLEPVDSARLTGNAAAALPSQPKGVVQLTAPDGKTAQGKFN